MGARHWARSLQGLAGVGARPGAAWVLRATQHTRQLLPLLTGEQLLQCSVALAALAPEAAREVSSVLGFVPAQQQPAPPGQPPEQPQPQGPPLEGAVPSQALLHRPALRRPALPKQAAR
jgi:hypothetical protein